MAAFHPAFTDVATIAQVGLGALRAVPAVKIERPLWVFSESGRLPLVNGHVTFGSGSNHRGLDAGASWDWLTRVSTVQSRKCMTARQTPDRRGYPGFSRPNRPPRL